jgi:pimeloyl-ACP methyl ester carboxylesterase
MVPNVTVVGSGPRVVLLHGQMTTGAKAWSKQMALADRWTLVVPDLFDVSRADLTPLDFEVDASDVVSMLNHGDHLVGHSYGGIVALYAAALAPETVRSLTVVEAPLHGVLRGDPDVEGAIAEYEERVRTIHDPEAFLLSFFASIGVPTDAIPSPLPHTDARMAWLLMTQRVPWGDELPVGALHDASFPTLVVTGGHDAVLERVADAFAERLGPCARRAVIAGRGHLVQRTGQVFNELLEQFLLDV